MLGAWLNVVLCIMECRVPPSLYGQTALICMMAGSVSGSLAPSIAHMPEPYPMMISSLITTISFITTFFLPKPGEHLTYKDVNDEAQSENPGLAVQVSLLVNYQAQTTQNPPYLGLHAMSFQETATERNLGVQRPELVEEARDPEVIFGLSEHYSLKDIMSADYSMSFQAMSKQQSIQI